MANFSVASPIQIGLLLVLICWTTGSTGTDFSLEEEFRQLKENYVRISKFHFHVFKLYCSSVPFSLLFLFMSYQCNAIFVNRFK
jgi:hypothetical protein